MKAKRIAAAALLVIAAAVAVSLVSSVVYKPEVMAPSVGYDEFSEGTVGQVREATKTLAIIKTTTTRPSSPASLEVGRRMVAFRAEISMEAESLDDAVDRFAEIAESLGGYVARMREARQVSQRVVIVVKVPSSSFGEAIRLIERVGRLIDKSIQSEDVTEEYIDLAARLKNLRRQEARLREILELAGTVDDVLKVERELWRVRGEIERIEGRMKYLERRVEMATIIVSITTPLDRSLPPLDLYESIRTGIAALYLVVRGMIILGLAASPIAILAAPTYIALRYRRRLAKRETAQPPRKDVYTDG